MSAPTLSAAMEQAKEASMRAEARGRAYERHVSTLLEYLDSIVARYPEALSETQRVVCASIARDTNSATFMPKVKL